MMGRYVEAIEDVPCGNICGLVKFYKSFLSPTVKLDHLSLRYDTQNNDIEHNDTA
jgi:hypothetical protein